MRADRGRNKRLVLSALELGPASTDELMTVTGLTRHQVRSALDKLVCAGVVNRPVAKYWMHMHPNQATPCCGVAAESG